MNRSHIDKVVKAHTGMAVQSGPFKFMRLVDRTSWGDGDMTPKLLGVYEEELHPVLLEMTRRRYGAVVVVGCAEGFYAVGAALLFPGIPILAYDVNKLAVEIMLENAALNGVADRIIPGAFCTDAELAAAAARYARLLVICDCEGYEVELFGSERAQSALAHSDLIVECHDFAVPNCTPAVHGFFAPTHETETIFCGGRNPNLYPYLARFNDMERWLAVSENRPCVMNWVVAHSRNPLLEDFNALAAGRELRMLITYHGTVVYFDVESGSLRHAAPGACEANLYLRASAGTATLFWRVGDSARPLGQFGPAGCGLGRAGAALQEKEIGPGLFAFASAGSWICAELDGSLTCSRPVAREFEIFMPIDTAAFSRLAHIVSNKWLRRRAGETMELNTAVALKAFNLQIGTNVLPLPALLAPDQQPRELYLTMDGWKLERYVLYRPLAYFVAYGKAEIFALMKLAVHSLFEFGAWDSDVLIITDESHVGEVNDMFASFDGRLIVAAVPAADILDYTLARYKIVDLDIAARYQPLIYLDTDIICDAPLKDFLAAMAFSDVLQIYPEALPISVKQDFFGTSLLTADGVGSGERDTGISSGVFAFSNPASQRDLFHRIIDIADKVTQSTGRSFFQFYDQPFFNYVLYKSKLDAGTGLSQIVHLYYNFRPALAAPVGKGLVHFAGGVGNATPKLEQMENYIEVLRQQQRKEVSSAF